MISGRYSYNPIRDIDDTGTLSTATASNGEAMAVMSGDGSMKFPNKPPLTPKHIEERIKLAASGLQALTLTLLAAVVLAPELNVSLVAPLWAKIVAGAVAGLAELFAFVLLGYIPPSR